MQIKQKPRDDIIWNGDYVTLCAFVATTENFAVKPLR